MTVEIGIGVFYSWFSILPLEEWFLKYGPQPRDQCIVNGCKDRTFFNNILWYKLLPFLIELN